MARTLEVDPEDPVAPWLWLYLDWFQANCVHLIWAERSMASPELGFAGTADLLMDHQAHGLTLVDLRTQGVKVLADGQEMKRTAYKRWCSQLAAYRLALGQPPSPGSAAPRPVACLNLIINSREPAEPVEHRWSEEEIQRGWLAFQAAQTLWSIERNYDPRVGNQ